MPDELLGSCGIGLSSARAKIKQIIAKHVHMKGLVLFMYYKLCNISYDRPHLVRNLHFLPKSAFYVQSVMLSPRFIPSP